MQAQHLHSWQITADQAKTLQQDLAAMVSRRSELGAVNLIAGVDISSPSPAGLARAAVVVLHYPDLALVESKIIIKEVKFPYVPGLLSFRESPLIIAACEELKAIPDLIFVDGQGIAHPRRMGLASHLGLLWDRPTIGCAKSRLCGKHDVVPPDAGSYAEINDNDEVIGAALRTRSGSSPLYISIGHKIDLQTSIKWVLRCCRGQRLPEPARMAHLAASGHPETPESVKAQC